MYRLVEGWSGSPLPILSTRITPTAPSWPCRKSTASSSRATPAKSIRCLGFFEHYVNGKEIANRILAEGKSNRMTPMMFEFGSLSRGRKATRSALFWPKARKKRILRATDILLRREVAEIILLGNVIETIRSKASALNLDIARATLIDPVKSPKFDGVCQGPIMNSGEAKGITPGLRRGTS